MRTWCLLLCWFSSICAVNLAMAESLESVAIVKPVKPVKPLETLETLTSQAAEVIVAAQMVAKSNNEAVQRARIAAVPAIEEWEARVGGRTF